MNPPYTHMYTLPFFEATPPDPRLKPGPVFVTSGGVTTEDMGLWIGRGHCVVPVLANMGRTAPGVVCWGETQPAIAASKVPKRGGQPERALRMVRPRATPPRAFEVFVRFCIFSSYLIEAQRYAQYRGRFAFVRQAECAHKTKPRGGLLGYKGRILGLLVFGVVVVAVSRLGGFWHRCELNTAASRAS